MLKQFKKGVKTKLSTNFSSDEWDCNCSYSECQWTYIEMDHVARLQEMRNKWGRPVNIHSGYRCEKRNKEEGGATHSRHKVSDATDIVVDGMTPDQVADSCEHFPGLGRYDTFTHIDSRPNGPARWDFRTKKDGKR